MSDLSWIDDFAKELQAQVWEEKQERMKAVWDNIVNPRRDHSAEAERKRLLGLD